MEILVVSSHCRPGDFDTVESNGHEYHIAVCSDGVAVIAAPPAERIFIDWILPEESGLELCRRLKAHAPTAASHITLVLETDDFESRRMAIRAGADDYMVGPLCPDKLRAKVAGDHSGRISPNVCLTRGPLRLEEAAQRVTYRDCIVRLMPNEFRLLRFLMACPNRVVSRQEIIAALGKGDQSISERTVDVWIGRLRRALRSAGAKRELRTVRNVGYVLDPAAEDEPATAH